jgi:hypothetical protein
MSNPPSCNKSREEEQVTILRYTAGSPDAFNTWSFPTKDARAHAINASTVPVDDEEPLVLDHVRNHEDSVHVCVGELKRAFLALDVEGQNARLAELQDVSLDAHLCVYIAATVTAAER